MTRDQLISKLAELDVHPNSYSLDGLRDSECVCVVRINKEWEVSYVERDMPAKLASFSAVEDAYDFVYATFFLRLGASTSS